ncbi:MAG: hypothetical protein A2Z15_03700, partial [Chloroflexi bacterium RBG_16_50_11]
MKMEKVYSIVPASSGPYMFIWILSLVLIALIVFFVYIGYASRHASFAVTDDGLRIRASLYSRTIPKADIAVEGVKVINLKLDSQYKPKMRTNGIGLPGYAEGWFKLQNKEKALLFLTDSSRVVYVPTK